MPRKKPTGKNLPRKSRNVAGPVPAVSRNALMTNDTEARVHVAHVLEGGCWYSHTDALRRSRISDAARFREIVGGLERDGIVESQVRTDRKTRSNYGVYYRTLLAPDDTRRLIMVVKHDLNRIVRSALVGGATAHDLMCAEVQSMFTCWSVGDLTATVMNLYDRMQAHNPWLDASAVRTCVVRGAAPDEPGDSFRWNSPFDGFRPQQQISLTEPDETVLVTIDGYLTHEMEYRVGVGLVRRNEYVRDHDDQAALCTHIGHDWNYGKGRHSVAGNYASRRVLSAFIPYVTDHKTADRLANLDFEAWKDLDVSEYPDKLHPLIDQIRDHLVKEGLHQVVSQKI